MKPKTSRLSDDLRSEYKFDYAKTVRGKYYKRILKEGANVAVLEPDVAKAFPNSAAVNDALRVVLKAGQAARRLPTRTRTRKNRRAPISDIKPIGRWGRGGRNGKAKKL